MFSQEKLIYSISPTLGNKKIAELDMWALKYFIRPNPSHITHGIAICRGRLKHIMYIKRLDVILRWAVWRKLLDPKGVGA